jgi:hypothetical protein
LRRVRTSITRSAATWWRRCLRVRLRFTVVDLEETQK